MNLPPPSPDLPPPSPLANLPPPAQHAPEVVVSTIIQPPPPVVPKKEEEIPDRPLLDRNALLTDAKTYVLDKGRPHLLRIGPVLALCFAIGAKLPFAGVVITLVCAIYFGDYIYRIIATTLAGSDTLPAWPKTNEPVEELIRPGVRMVSAFIVAHIPLLIVYLNASAPLYRVNPIAWTIASALPCLYFPFAAMMIVMQERFAASWPHVAFGALKRCLPAAWSAILLCAATIVVMRVGQLIPYVGDFLGSFAMIASMMMLARNAGMLAAQHRHTLNELH